MKKEWNREERRYEYSAEGLYIDGQDYDFHAALAKWKSRGGNALCRSPTAQSIVKAMIKEKAMFEKHHHWLEEMEHQILLRNHANVERFKGKGARGSHTILLSSIPPEFRPGILQIANENSATLCRGMHSTTPSHQVNAVEARSTKEYHLIRTSEKGRATTAMKGGEMFIYYSKAHTEGTYSYYLVTHPVSVSAGGTQVSKIVPLSGGTRDRLIPIPIH